jgi:hypothetical protein
MLLVTVNDLGDSTDAYPSLKGELSALGFDQDAVRHGTDVREVLRDLFVAARLKGTGRKVPANVLGQLVRDLREALTANVAKAIPPDRMWRDPTSADVITHRRKSRHYSPVDPARLTAVAAKYLQYSIGSSLFEYYLLAGLVCDALALALHETIRRSEDAALLLLYDWVDEDLSRVAFWRPWFWLGLLLARWIAIPALLAGMYWYSGYELRGPWVWVMVAWLLYLGLRMLRTPLRLFRRRDIRNRAEERVKINEKLVAQYEAITSGVFNPSQVQHDLLRLTEAGCAIPAAVFAILARAIERDPAVFAIRRIEHPFDFLGRHM